MSTWVNIVTDPVTKRCECPNCWNEHTYEATEELFSRNITANLTTMADMVGIYEAIWTPHALDATKAKDLIVPLTKGLIELRSKPDFYKTFNPKTGWGNYEGFVNFVEEYLQACKDCPEGNLQ